jgi:hypothetical protein
VIGLDIELIAPEGYEEGTDNVLRAGDDELLLEAIQYANSQKIPVILGGMYIDQPNGKTRVAQLFRDSDLLRGTTTACPRCSQYGYINAPEDRRLIAGTERLVGEDDKRLEMKPFSLVVAEAYLNRDTRRAENEDAARVAKAESEEKPLFGTFIREDHFRSLTTLEYLYKPELRERCDNRIVLIGGHWNDIFGYGDIVDMHLSPAGSMSGLGLHANYIESLLLKQVAHEVPLWVDIVIDILLGLVIYTLFELAHGWRIVLVLTMALFVPLFCAWIALVAANLYLDFLFPIELYFLHIVYELFEDYFHTKRGEAAMSSRKEGSCHEMGHN